MTTVELCPYCHTENVMGIEGDFDPSYRSDDGQSGDLFAIRDGGQMMKLLCHGCKMVNIWRKDHLVQIVKQELEILRRVKSGPQISWAEHIAICNAERAALFALWKRMEDEEKL